MTPEPFDAAAEQLLRDAAPHVLGALVRRFGDFSAAEDAVAEALVAGALQWPSEGVPTHPRAWLIHVATRRMADRARSELARRRRETNAAARATDLAPAADIDDESERDDTLLLLFMCCHPSLTAPSAIALTLRAVGGLTTAEIANAFMVPEATMAQRISRAKNSIKTSGRPFEAPTDRDRSRRIGSVLHILYLIFNEGYASSVGSSLQRTDLANDAIRLSRAVREVMPDDTEVAGLLALMLLTDARRAARTGPGGELIPLTQQNRALWNRHEISEGVALISATLAKGAIGPYQLQAAIAAVHDEADTAADTDWPQILALYELLERMSDNPMVTLNRAIAAAMVQGPAKGLALLRTLDADARLMNHHRLAAVRAHLLEMAGDTVAAITQYRIAAARTTNIPERNYLATQAARLAQAPEAPPEA